MDTSKIEKLAEIHQRQDKEDASEVAPTENTSGYFPMLHHILLKHITPEANRSIIKLTHEMEMREDMGQVHAYFVAAGPEAFVDKPQSKLPKVGDQVVIAKLAGFFIMGDDGEKYRFVSDLDIVAVKGDRHE
jgi:co-chaperonin GroES (HSP10)